MRLNRIYYVLILACFIIGLVFWKIHHTGRRTGVAYTNMPENLSPKSTVVYVGEEAISADDLEWEVKLHTLDLPPESEAGKDDKKKYSYKSALNEHLLSSMIERKVLYHYVKQDSEFDMTDPRRYTNCLKDWQAWTQTNPKLAAEKVNSERLKSKLCEQEILMQYVQEKIYPRVQISDQDLTEYFNKHKDEFDQPPQVIIKQIVLATEDEAKKIMHKVNNGNFDEMAKQYSITPEGQKGGLLGPFAKGQLPHVFDVAFFMQPGEIKGIVKSNYGFHIIKLEKKIPHVKGNLSEGRERVKAALVKQKQDEEYKKWVETALNAIAVKTPSPLW